MRKLSILVIAVAALAALTWVMAGAASPERQTATQVTGAPAAQLPDVRAACSMTYSSNTIASFFGGFAPGMMIVSYYDPEYFCTAPVYPFEVTGFSFTLLDNDGSYVWPVTVDVVVLAAGDSCDGPGAEVCRWTQVCDSITYAFPNVGTSVPPTPCCIAGPAYIGIEYIDGQAGTTPSVCFDNGAPTDSCINWFNYQGTWYEWYNIWNPPQPGYPMFWVDGETVSPNCGQLPCEWNPGDPYKMHYPQLPDEAGWDVNATFPAVMADDWQCIETGWVKDIHWWGSWRDGVTGVIDSFGLSIHSNITDQQNPDGYSIPGEQLWYRVVHDWEEVPIQGVDSEGWMDPLTGDVRELNHTEYFQYNVCFDNPDDWFWQEVDSIYWLDVTAFIQDTMFKWGWKTSLEHFMDDAVFLGEPLCLAPDNGDGTVDLPADCPYVDDDDPFRIIDGFPPGDEIICDPVFDGFYNQLEYPGGSLGGDIHEYNATLTLTMTGTGSLSGFTRSIPMEVWIEVHTGPRTHGDPVQTFPAVIWTMTGQIVGDPDFEQLSLVAGEASGLPSPGEFTLTVYDDPNFWVESFFDVTYQIDFIGAPGSVLADYAGTTTATSRIFQGGESMWRELREPVLEADWKSNGWFVELGPTGDLVNGAGEDAYGNGWYYYPEDNWWNIWFYDHPYDPTRWKEVHFDIFQMLETGPEAFIEIAVNWSTDLWFIDQPPGDSAPPLPGVEEQPYIGRDILYAGPPIPEPMPLDWVWTEYNPEWVSVDVRGVNVVITEAVINHSCTGWGFTGESLDMAFVITGEPEMQTEACCFPDGTCQDLLPDDCINLGGTPLGSGTACNGIEACCLPDGTCIDADPQCCALLGGSPQGPGSQCSGIEACCFTDGSCAELDPLCCAMFGGTPQGPGTQCTGLEACCFQDGGCANLDPICCLDLGGTPQGPGSQCAGYTVACCFDGGTSCMTVDSACCEFLGGYPSPFGEPSCLSDGNGDGFDDACVYPYDSCSYYKPPYEDYAPAGMPDFDQKQDGWFDPTGTQWAYCGPVALANCFWWFDSKFEPIPNPPPAVNDNYPLVFPFGAWDDHDPNNVIPFVDTLAGVCGTNVGAPGTSLPGMLNGINTWLSMVGLVDDYTVNLIPGADPNIYDIVTEQVLESQDVILLLGFWADLGGGNCYRFGGHYVTVAGVCPEDAGWCISDPFYDMHEGEPPAGSAHPSFVHNDAQFVSGPHGTIHHDKYFVIGPSPCGPFLTEIGGYASNPTEIVNNFQFQNEGEFPSEGYQGGDIRTVIENAIIICPAVCDAVIGDANGSGGATPIDIDDVVYLIAYIFAAGPPPTPYTVASGDANCSCFVDIDDVTYLIAFIFSGGPPPCTCEDWVAACGSLH